MKGSVLTPSSSSSQHPINHSTSSQHPITIQPQPASQMLPLPYIRKSTSLHALQALKPQGVSIHVHYIASQQYLQILPLFQPKHKSTSIFKPNTLHELV
jgi:hypothetical protein